MRWEHGLHLHPVRTLPYHSSRMSGQHAEYWMRLQDTWGAEQGFVPRCLQSGGKNEVSTLNVHKETALCYNKTHFITALQRLGRQTAGSDPIQSLRGCEKTCYNHTVIHCFISISCWLLLLASAVLDFTNNCFTGGRSRYAEGSCSALVAGIIYVEPTQLNKTKNSEFKPQLYCIVFLPLFVLWTCGVFSSVYEVFMDTGSEKMPHDSEAVGLNPVGRSANPDYRSADIR